ncbi:hypothetical protein [Candidatus Binatus sp.]|uniref:hypothetical protein n=1 Tax=Candidatus Binatus sp. TaxID=2811406 RepID=UPI002F421050
MTDDEEKVKSRTAICAGRAGSASIASAAETGLGGRMASGVTDTAAQPDAIVLESKIKTKRSLYELAEAEREGFIASSFASAIPASRLSPGRSHHKKPRRRSLGGAARHFRF